MILKKNSYTGVGMGKSLIFGDYHQAFALFQALKTLVILHMHRVYKHLTDHIEETNYVRFFS